MDRYVLNVWKLVTQPGDSINFLDMKKSSVWLTSALKTRTTIRGYVPLKILKGPGF